MKYLILILTTFSLISCVTSPSQHYAPQNIQISGEYRQESSGVVFPEQMQGFNRVSITKFDAKAEDVGVGYNHYGKQVALTLYSFPAPKVMSFGSPQEVIDTAKRNLFLNVYERSKQDILQGHQNSKLILERDHILEQGQAKHSGLHASFKYYENHAGKYQEVSSHLYLFQVGDILFKYRISYPVNIDSEREVVGFMKSFVLNSGT